MTTIERLRCDIWNIYIHTYTRIFSIWRPSSIIGLWRNFITNLQPFLTGIENSDFIEETWFTLTRSLRWARAVKMFERTRNHYNVTETWSWQAATITKHDATRSINCRTHTHTHTHIHTSIIFKGQHEENLILMNIFYCCPILSLLLLLLLLLLFMLSSATEQRGGKENYYIT